MANEIRTALDTATTFTQTLASLTNTSARQTTMVSNSTERPAALINYRLQSGATGPTAGSIYELFLLRSDGTVADDNAGASDAAITIENAPLLGTMILTTTTNKNFYGVFDTAALGVLGSSFGIAVRNSSGQTMNGTEGNHLKRYTLYVPEIQ
jgi:hypothetical protein